MEGVRLRSRDRNRTRVATHESTATQITGLQLLRKFVPLVKVDENSHMTWGLVTADVPDKDDERRSP